ncbi:PREDICTED: cytochrome P450 CYP82D47-like [Tarenaya hassleriana]|uniref:cytochrome P450 CYP82D47-like n=1 Tax=Tarenaya hassleriana TaxID=28532 RepID=UPI00053C3B51|nr:PREDICTED: cytochrome P450 CYP82D47-like [Tarenaya hassleriana]
MEIFPILLTLVSILVAASVFVRLHRRPTKNRREVPLAAGAWPVIGHLLFYDSKTPTHATFGDMSVVYGPVFATKLGSYTSIIISSQEIAKEIYTVHDKFLDRPGLTASKLLGYDDSFLTFKPYGPQWREMRKIAATELLSSIRVDMQSHYRAGEADVSFGNLWKLWESKGRAKNGVLVDMKREFQDLTANTSLMMVVGKRYFGDSPNCEKEEAMERRKLVRDFLDFFSLYLFSDFLPALGWTEWRVKRDMKRAAKELDVVLEELIAEHKNKKKHDLGLGEIKKTYLDLLMDTFEHTEIPGLDARTTTKALCLNLILAGSETAIVVLVWAVSLLVNNPHVIKKAQEELDNIVGKNRVVEESDIKDLVYIQAIVKETFRLYPPVPLVAFRHVLDDFDVANGTYHVPAGSLLLVNAWKIQRDPSLWSDPERFEPERFLTVDNDVDVGGQSFKLFPFGLGRRSCPAIPLGLRMVHYALARFLHSFEVAKPSIEEDMDMTESNGLVNLKATPLEVMVTPRLDPHLYQFNM